MCRSALSAIAIVDANAEDAASAVKTAWEVYRPDSKRQRGGKHVLILRDAQHDYIFTEAS
jgi:hypothetical protein